MSCWLYFFEAHYYVLLLKTSDMAYIIHFYFVNYETKNSTSFWDAS